MEFFKSNKIACKPVTTLQELFSWSHQTEEDLSRKYNVQKLKPQPKNRSQRQLIICHDMRNNYLDDCYFQGFNNPDDYTFYHWNLIDMFIYFSHHFVTIPPESWINAAHQNNVRMLGNHKVYEISFSVYHLGVKLSELQEPSSPNGKTVMRYVTNFSKIQPQSINVLINW